MYICLKKGRREKFKNQSVARNVAQGQVPVLLLVCLLRAACMPALQASETIQAGQEGSFSSRVRSHFYVLVKAHTLLGVVKIYGKH